jgi:hypothetical protein
MLSLKVMSLELNVYRPRISKFPSFKCFVTSSRLSIHSSHESFFFFASPSRPGVAQSVPGGLSPQISWHSAHEGGEVVSLTHRPPLPQKYSCCSFSLGAHSTPGRGTVGRKYVTEKSSDTTGNRSRDRPTSSAVPKPLRYPRPHMIA